MHDDASRKAIELSQKQREVLDLVVARKSSKEIARILGISKPTVDQRIALARQKFGAASRNELVSHYLGTASLYDRIVYDAAQLSQPMSDGAGIGSDEASGPIYSVEDVAGFNPAYVTEELHWTTHPLETLDKRFGIFGRLGAVGFVAALISLSLLAVLSIAETLTQLL